MTTSSVWRRIWLTIAAPLGALIIAFGICSVLLAITGHDPFAAYHQLGAAFGQKLTIATAIDGFGPYYLSAVAVAIGFRMNLFNIGVDGQYRIATLMAAALAGAAFMDHVPSVFRVLLTIVVAMGVGAVWAGIAVWLRVTRGVSEVISTLMLNSIATYVIAYLLSPGKLGVLNGQVVGTPQITSGGLVPDIPFGLTPIYTMTFLALFVGVLYAFLLNRTVFGFQLKATGLNPSAAAASGIGARKMAVTAMLLSGMVAGLVGIPELLNGLSKQYSANFPTGYGFTGIAIALLGRNHPVGMAFAALLWSCLDSSSNSLQGVGVPPEVVTIMEGTIVLSVVIAYEVVRRYRIVLQQKDVARALEAPQAVAVAA